MLTFLQLFWYNAYLGSYKINWNSSMSIFVLGSRQGIFIINLRYTLFLFLKSLKLVNNFISRKKQILFYVPIFLGTHVCFNIFKSSKIMSITKWVFGLLTNSKMLQKTHAHFFVNGFPFVLLILQNKDYAFVANESFRVKIPSIGFCDTNQNPLFLDYTIPGNTSSMEFIILYYKSILSSISIWKIKYKVNFYKTILKINNE